MTEEEEKKLKTLMETAASKARTQAVLYEAIASVVASMEPGTPQLPADAETVAQVLADIKARVEIFREIEHRASQPKAWQSQVEALEIGMLKAKLAEEADSPAVMAEKLGIDLSEDLEAIERGDPKIARELDGLMDAASRPGATSASLAASIAPGNLNGASLLDAAGGADGTLTFEGLANSDTVERCRKERQWMRDHATSAAAVGYPSVSESDQALAEWIGCYGETDERLLGATSMLAVSTSSSMQACKLDLSSSHTPGFSITAFTIRMNALLLDVVESTRFAEALEREQEDSSA